MGKKKKGKRKIVVESMIDFNLWNVLLELDIDNPCN